jgi:hypothetical protein
VEEIQTQEDAQALLDKLFDDEDDEEEEQAESNQTEEII